MLSISIKGVHFEDGVDPKETLSIHYNQYQEAPDSVSPATIVCRRVVNGGPDRSKIVRSKLEFERTDAVRDILSKSQS